MGYCAYEAMGDFGAKDNFLGFKDYRGIRGLHYKIEEIKNGILGESNYYKAVFRIDEKVFYSFRNHGIVSTVELTQSDSSAYDVFGGQNELRKIFDELSDGSHTLSVEIIMEGGQGNSKKTLTFIKGANKPPKLQFIGIKKAYKYKDRENFFFKISRKTDDWLKYTEKIDGKTYCDCSGWDVVNVDDTSCLCNLDDDDKSKYGNLFTEGKHIISIEGYDTANQKTSDSAEIIVSSLEILTDKVDLGTLTTKEQDNIFFDVKNQKNSGICDLKIYVNGEFHQDVKNASIPYRGKIKISDLWDKVKIGQSVVKIEVIENEYSVVVDTKEVKFTKIREKNVLPTIDILKDKYGSVEKLVTVEKVVNDCHYAEGSIFYKKTGKGFVYKYDLQQKKETKITNRNVSDFQICGDKIFYSSERYFQMYSNDLTENNLEETINLENVLYFQMEGQQVYYIDEKRKGLYRKELDGTNDVLVKNNIKNKFIVDSGVIYFLDENLTLFKTEITSDTLTKLDEKVHAIAFKNGLLLYATNSNGIRIKAYDVVTQTSTIIKENIECNIESISIKDKDNIFYTNELNVLYKFTIRKENEPFEIVYRPQDKDDTKLTVTETINDKVISKEVVDKGTEKTVHISNDLLKDLEAQKEYFININIDDGDKFIDRKFSFFVLNANPTISEEDKDLGNKIKPFDFNFFVNDSDKEDTLQVSVKLNDNIIKEVNNVERLQLISSDITQELFDNLEMDKQSAITIECKDNKGGYSKRVFKFTKTENPPTISEIQNDMGRIEENFEIAYVIDDIDGDSVTVIEKLDEEVVKSYNAELKKENVLTVPHNKWSKLAKGKHKLTIVATDVYGKATIREVEFEKLENNKIIVCFEQAIDTKNPIQAITIKPLWKNQDKCKTKVEVSGNFNGKNTIWEDCTNEVLKGEKYKLVSKQGNLLNVKLTLVKNENVTEEIEVSGIKATYEVLE